MPNIEGSPNSNSTFHLSLYSSLLTPQSLTIIDETSRSLHSVNPVSCFMVLIRIQYGLLPQVVSLFLSSPCLTVRLLLSVSFSLSFPCAQWITSTVQTKLLTRNTRPMPGRGVLYPWPRIWHATLGSNDQYNAGSCPSIRVSGEGGGRCTIRRLYRRRIPPLGGY
jgi:hypothetical protein